MVCAIGLLLGILPGLLVIPSLWTLEITFDESEEAVFVSGKSKLNAGPRRLFRQLTGILSMLD